MIKKRLSILLLLLSFNSYALVGAGTLAPFIGTYQDDEFGGSETVFDLQPYISLNTRIRIFNEFFYVPEFGYAFAQSAYDDGDAQKRSYMFFLQNFGYRMNFTFLRFGVGTFITTIHGEGGTFEGRNGDDPRTFYLPSENRKSYNTTLNLGAEQYILGGDVHSIKLEFYIWNMVDSDRRINFTLSYNYYLSSL